MKQGVLPFQYEEEVYKIFDDVPAQRNRREPP